MISLMPGCMAARVKERARKESFMKKTTALILVLAVLTVLGLSAAAADGEPLVGMPNPLIESSVSGILETVGVSMPAPEFANSASWFVINTDPAVGELRFSVNGLNYTYRITPATAFSDISGMYYTWTGSENVQVGYNTAVVSYIENEQGIIQWFDVVPGLMYSLSVDSGAQADELTEIANMIYEPVQGDEG